MRVALFTDTFVPDVNGVAKTLGRWVKYLEARGAQCRVFAPQSPAAAEADQWMVERFYSIPFSLYPECRMAIPNPMNLKKALKAFSPDLIHLATPFNLGLVGLHYARRKGIPAVASYHTHFDQYLAYYKLQWMEPMLWKYMLWFHQDCRRIFVPSHSTMKHLQNKGLKELEIWSRGVDVKRFHPVVNREEVLRTCNIPPEKFVLLYVGRLAVEKSVDLLFSTFDSLPEPIRSRAHLAVAGDGPLLRPLQEQYAARSDVTFTGFREGKALSDLYAAADLFLFPSATETFGNVVLEAMASGTPVVGADAGGVADTVRHGSTGILCRPGSLSDFVEAVERLYNNPSQRAELAGAARAYSLEQSWDSIFDRLYASCREVLAAGTAQESPNEALPK
ncbi:glycosyltransferase family 4 protein [Paenibacillus mucilaginosus]|uniref:Group 1 glycosyl transferase n=2 Tax=Paenibacillus mucilaginosus TaxID=61624 RepID=H6NTD6_9BACL|nr:glycosyltransferase family 1 protein [Paenibacillus mucilaginosus]AEI39321.1 glycosyl transferase group 1 [Paenibacillus mucilaginosus KNP414]AFC27598.1 group 1 glycosyl transferase [Paenibacillus mucilaginosus 3016]MCG7216974.1 glycosyltransferase family 1 protein [Paenibacillus mucilaginosus]WDM28316.1 glycosyltransferase family 1 protein [Paenibacillus mucilaginosus]WFA16489.1 glycosyltransferase family 1 protein [Paenibacillus mucilaginosus]